MPDTGHALLDNWIERLKKLGGPSMPAEVAKALAPKVDAEIKRTAAAGQDPMGKPWPLKKDGGQALVHAAEHISTEALGNVCVTTLEGPDVFHHKGLGGKPRRQVIPERLSMSSKLREVMVDGAKEVFRRITGGAA